MGTKCSVLLYSLEVIEGIGTVCAKALAEAGITTIAAIMEAGTSRIRALCPNISESEIEGWLCLATLLRVKGMTPALAGAFARTGVCSTSQLAETRLEDLERAVKCAHSEGRLAKMPSVYDLAAMQQSAWKLRDYGMIAGRILDSSGTPISQVMVDIGRQVVSTDETGWFAFDAISSGTVQMQIYRQNRRLPLHFPSLDIRPERLTGPMTIRIADPCTPELPAIREIDGYPIVNTRAARMQLTWREFCNLPEGDLLQIRDIDDDGMYLLLSYYKERIGPVIYIFRTKVSAADLPDGVKEGDIVMHTKGGLQRTTLTMEEVVALKYQKTQTLSRRSHRRIVRVSIKS